VFGVYDGDDDRVVAAVDECDEREKTARVARRMTAMQEADRFRRVVRPSVSFRWGFGAARQPLRHFASMPA